MPIRAGAGSLSKDFYSFEYDGSRNVEVEEWFSRLEDKIAPIISNLPVTKREPTPDEEAWLALFMGPMYTRTPLGRRLSDEKFGPATAQMLKEAAADPENFREIYVSVDTGFPDEETAEQVRRDILSGRGEDSAHARILSWLRSLRFGRPWLTFC